VSANRTQRMLQFICEQKVPVSLRRVVESVASPSDNITRLTVAVAGQLLQQVQRKKLNRSGVAGDFRYSTNELTFLDLRSLPRPKRASVPHKPRAPKPKPTPKPPVRVTEPRTVTSTLPPRKPGERETVEQFLARGGRVQQLAHGESSRPPFEDLRALGARSMRAKLAADAENNPTDDDELAVA
jgi:hypothetical protein